MLELTATDAQAIGRADGWSTTRLRRPPDLLNGLIMAIPTLAALGASVGSVNVLGVPMYPFKVVVPLTAAMIAIRGQERSAYRAAVTAMAGALAAWALASTLWSPAGAEAIREGSIFVFVTILLYVTCSCLSSRRIDALLVGWPIAVGVTSLVAAWEFASQSHLPSDFASAHYGAFVVLSTFDNPNNYGAFLAVAAFACALYAVRGHGGARREAIGWTTAAISLVLLPFTGSRISLAAVAAGGLLATLMIVKSRSGPLIAIASATFAMIGLSLGLRASPALASKFADLGSLYDASTSTGTRAQLIRFGTELFTETGGVGVGAGGFEARASVELDAVNPHNLWIEIVSQYGLVGIALVAAIVLLALRTAAPFRRPGGSSALLVGSLLCFVVAATAASSYINDPIGWTFFATFVGIAGALGAEERAQ